MSQAIALPHQFAEFARFADWAQPTTALRIKRRLSTSREQRLEFYNAMMGRIREIMEFLNGYPLDAMPPDVKHLFHMSLGLAAIGINVEWYDGHPSNEHLWEHVNMQHEPDKGG